MKYNVHIYREMRLYFPGIEASAPDEAAKIAADLPTSKAEYTEDCDAQNLAALVDVHADEEHKQSVAIDFEAERLRKAVPALLDAIAAIKAALQRYLHWKHSVPGHLMTVADAALAQAKGNTV